MDRAVLYVLTVCDYNMDRLTYATMKRPHSTASYTYTIDNRQSLTLLPIYVIGITKHAELACFADSCLGNFVLNYKTV